MCVPKLINIQASFVATVFLLIFCTVLQQTLGATSNELETGVGSGDGKSGEIWQYFLDKYSASKSVLTYSEVDSIISHNCLRNQSSDSQDARSSCQITQQRFPNVSGLHSICNYILYSIDNPNCCSKIRLNHPSDKSLEIASDDGRRKPSSSEGQWSLVAGHDRFFSRAIVEEKFSRQLPVV